MLLSIPLTLSLAKLWFIQISLHSSWHVWTWRCAGKWRGSRTAREIYSWLMVVQVHFSHIPHHGCWKVWALALVWSAPKRRATCGAAWYGKSEIRHQEAWWAVGFYASVCGKKGLKSWEHRCREFGDHFNGYTWTPWPTHDVGERWLHGICESVCHWIVWYYPVRLDCSTTGKPL